MTDDYLQRFGGLTRLYGRAGLLRLHAAHVCVVGLGGVGSWVVEALARSGVGALTLVDLDDLCITNVNRQLPAMDGTIGRPKAEVIAERVSRINPACRVRVLTEFFTSQNAERILAEGFDCVVDAIDNVSNKALLLAECVTRGLPAVTVGGAGGRSEFNAIRTGDLGEAWGDELLRLVRRKLRRAHGFEAGTQKGRMQFGVRCVWSSEPRIFPWADGTCRTEPAPEAGREGAGKLDCESGLGAAAFVTGAFGLAAAGEALRCVISPRLETAVES
ncbi:sulfur acceptor protein CsdL [Cephaloticoccus capnophilus]|uniref:Sulfur acceptor protein CsdL n=1 Tax=Cephaloticoccus capnophilus TaxID=1548208 RepID=A0A139SL86_9BACT|nr:tRNA threonylcarbamoyladenosine dehydratase [Cephaloticoccus capnophilus]KXU35315.1 sulfur acceptor protein CsdL [Cephaloticoccus capnophilus]